VDVPLVAVGTSLAVTQLNGTLLHPNETVKVRALPDRLPQSIEFSVESLVDFDTSIYVRDLAIPEEVTLLTDGDEIVAKVQQPRIEVEEVPVVEEEAEEGEAAAEGAAPEGGAAGESTATAEADEG
jgi:large subunit ribosomal protein L25